MNSYFSHDSDARNDEKIIKLRMKYGAEGYGIYFMILERLRSSKEYMSTTDYNTLAYDFRVDAAKVKSIVEDFGLFAFTENSECFYSDSFMNRMAIKDGKSKKRAEAGKKGAAKRWNDKKAALPINNNSNAIAKPSNKDSNAIAMPSKNIASKVKESKVNKSNKEHSPANAEPPVPNFNYSAVIEYLNRKSGKHFRDTPTNRKLIRSRLDEGFSAKEIAQAIDNVVLAWLHNPEMVRYIQPSTIFRASKFEGYVNSPPYAKSGSRQSQRETLPDWAQPGYESEEQKMTPEEVATVKARIDNLKKKQEGIGHESD